MCGKWASTQVATSLIVLASWAGAAPAAEALAKPPAATAPATEAGPAAVTVAILDYETAAKDNPALGAQIADILTARLSGADGLELVERATLAKVMEEHKLALAGLADPDQAAKVGKLLGAQILLMGKAFLMDGKLMIVTKLVGVQTGRVVGTLRQVEASKPISEAIMLVAEDVAEQARKKADRLLPNDARVPDPVADIRQAAAKAFGANPPTVAVVIPEQHVRRVVVDPAVETEIKKVLLACGFRVVDAGQNALADWAKGMMKGEHAAWPAALHAADAVVVGEGFSEFALRTGELVTCAARAEINLIDRRTGRVLLSDRQTRRAVDLSELIAGKTALEAAGRKLGIEVARAMLAVKPSATPTPATPASRPAAAGPGAGSTVMLAPAALVAAALAATADAPAPAAPAPAAPAPAAKDAPATRTVRRTVFAAQFDNQTQDGQYDPAAEGMGDLVAVLLAEQEHIRVVERQKLLALAEEQAKALKGLTGQNYAIQAGKLLKADTVLVGRLFLVDKKLTVSVQALDIATARVAAAEQLTCRPEDIMEASLQLARALGKQMALPLPDIDLKKVDASPIASLHFAKALSRYYAGNMDEAIMQFMRTMDLDPDYVEAHYWCGMAHSRLGEDDHAIIEWDKFLERCPKSKHDTEVRKLLAEARQREKESTVDRLGPSTTRPAGAATRPAKKAD